ncbi:DUF960 domain-containing protein [Lapidilactobacillus mulanensis]|uniref:DUF960 domain-containing protein n=1 Tax=Lapidilactobacillus mulanensis TaxID=2485999 RepID=A0ABW4DMH7_9LACO|nr:DUF960 domain-containing protein [Lapidilactobacillus mulanensis]
MFKSPANRFASFGVVSILPGELIDQIWSIIDQNLQGMFPLDNNVLTFELRHDQKNHVQYVYHSDDSTDTIAFDTEIVYQAAFPDTLLVYDDGQAQTILLPSEAN